MGELIKEKSTVPAAGLTVIDKLRLLLEITKKISRSLEIEEVLNLVMDTLDSLLPYDAAGIYLIECQLPAAGKRTGDKKSGAPAH